jgi:hypothetical protein
MAWTNHDTQAARQWLEELQGRVIPPGARLVTARLPASAVPPPHEDVFGLWRDRSQDALEMEESSRQEWSQL